MLIHSFHRRETPQWLILVGILLLGLVVSQRVLAHEIRPAIVGLALEENGHYALSISLNLEALIAEIGPEQANTDDSQNAARYESLRRLPPAQLTQAFEEFSPKFLSGITLLADGTRLEPRINDVSIPAVGDVDLARNSVVTLTGGLPSGTEALVWRWDARFGANALRVSSERQPEIYSAYLQDGQPSADIPTQGIVEQSAVSIFVDYVKIGFAHILPKGLDHILFVIGLFLLSASLRSLLLQVTCFTLAHTVTLALGILGIIQLPASIVEPLIAASIVYVCVENIYSDRLSRWRPVVIFAFGLLHGLGFASVLAEIGLNPSHFVTGLIAFNVGVELGQLTVILGCFLAVGIWFRHKRWYRQRITIPASLVIAAIGSYWVIERTLLS